jgi:hypothetical protein
MFTWDFGDGKSATGVLSPNGVSTVPVVINGLGNATFTVTHSYSGDPVPHMATIRIFEGLGGTGSDSLLFTGCDDDDERGWHHGHIDDEDCDGFPDHDHGNGNGRGHEDFLGTDPNDVCPDDADDDAWPPDFNNSGHVSLSDLVGFGPHFNKNSSHPNYRARFDLTGSGAIDLSDIVTMGAFFNKNCDW